MRDPMMLLVTAIEHTKQLWEVYKTEEIRVYLEYLKGLYDRELEKLEKQWYSPCPHIFNSGRVRFVFRVVCVWCVLAPHGKLGEKHEQTVLHSLWSF